MVTATAGYHREVLPIVVEYVVRAPLLLAVATQSAGDRRRGWAGHHRWHDKYSDTEPDRIL